jgi:hypothetical protein
MANQSPFNWVQPSKLGRMFVFIFVVTIILIVSMQVLGAPLRTETAPGGIISYEFSGDLETARAILSSWGDEGQVYAGLQLGLDYLFIPAYALAIGLGCVLVSQYTGFLSAGLIRLGTWLAWGQFIAAGLDALENYALIRLLLGSNNALWPSVAFWSAAVKFGLVAVGLLYVILGVLLRLAGRPKAQETI